jgi:glycosyltransferase involved in cell wall biosynthesis
MKICIVSAMFYSGRKVRVENRPEVVLAEGLRKLGHEVVTHHHWDHFDTNEVDVIHVHHLGIGVLRAMFIPPRVPLVYTNHDLRSKHGLLSHSKNLVFRALLARVDTLVALSVTEATFLGERYGVDPDRVQVIYNGVDSECFSYSRTNRAGQSTPFRLLYVGQLIAIKGVDLLLRSLAQVSFDWRLDLVFHTSDVRSSLEALAGELGITEKICFLGQLPANELADRYHAADVVVVPSLTESLPSVVTEAMLCGTPVIATDVGGILEQLGGYGIVIPSGDIRSMTKAMDSITDAYATFAAQGPHMSSYARERFNIPEMIASHVRLYASLVKHRREPRVWQRWPICSAGATAVGCAIALRRRGLL